MEKLPPGDFAIVELFGHSTMVGCIAEIERFGTKMLAIEPIWQSALLPEVLVGGSSIYRLTACSAEVASARQAKREYELPASVVATLPAPEFAPAFLYEGVNEIEECAVAEDIASYVQPPVDVDPVPHRNGCDCFDCEMPF